MITSFNQKGFGLGEAFILVLVLGALGVGGYTVMKQQDKAAKTGTNSQTVPQQESAEPVSWKFNEQEQKWVVTGTPPECSTPLLSTSPVDTSKATSVLYPGQYRGGNYKPHGGFAFDGLQTSDVQVVAPLDAKLTGLVRYIEMGELQYKVNFQNQCGVEYMFDHLYTLSPELMTVAETTPAPTEGTGSLPLTGKQIIPIKAGQVIATAVGHPATNNTGMDFGVYDLRQRNEISKNAKWAAIHNMYTATEWYGICWFDRLPAADVARVKTLPSRDSKSGTRSDYCTNSTGTTLDVNDGKPV